MSDLFYDEFADYYDEMINWESRLKFERKHFKKLFGRYGVRRVLDAGCGTGRHSILFAGLGLSVVGIDISEPMLEQAKRNAEAEGAKGVKFAVGNFAELTKTIRGRFGAVVCLGNSLPHLIADADVVQTLREFYSLLRKGGLLVLQGVHFDHYLDSAESAVAVTDGERDGRPITFRRHYEFKGTKVIFHVSVFDRYRRELLENYNSPLNPIRRELLETFLEKVGFTDIQFYKDIAMRPRTAASKNIACLARKPEV